MDQTHPPESPRDLYVRVALLEQAQLHSEDRVALQNEMTASRLRAAEEQIGRVAVQVSYLESRLRESEHWSQRVSGWLTQQAADLEAIEDKQARSMLTGDRVRYAIAAAMVVLSLLAVLPPEQAAKLSKILALVP